jgi:circadian clock protein KaiC
MVDDGKVRIERLATGVPALDSILAGGIPAGTLNILTGGPGAGKSVFALQFLFHQARLGKKQIYFTSIAEPALKFLRYMQQFEFFDASLVGKSIFLSDLSGPALSDGLEGTIGLLKRRIEDGGPAVIAIDSFRALRSRLSDPSSVYPLLYDLVVTLAVSDVTAILVGEYDDYDVNHLPEFFAADGIISLSRVTEGLRVSRQLEVLKLRGSAYEQGRHFFEITSAGVTAYPRVGVPREDSGPGNGARLSSGVPGLDRMLGGGFPLRSSTVLEGASGTGKTTLALSFLIEGARKGEPCLFFTMDENRGQIIDMAARRGWDLGDLIAQGLMEVVYISPLDYVADAVLQQARDLTGRLGAKRVAIDSLTALNLSIAAEGRDAELVYALVKTFRSMGVTSILTSEHPQLLGATELTAHGLSAIADNIILLRYSEVESRLARGIVVLKVRGSSHDDTLRELIISAHEVRVGEPFRQSRGVLSGEPTPGDPTRGKEQDQSASQRPRGPRSSRSRSSSEE